MAAGAVEALHDVLGRIVPAAGRGQRGGSERAAITSMARQASPIAVISRAAVRHPRLRTSKAGGQVARLESCCVSDQPALELKNP